MQTPLAGHGLCSSAAKGTTTQQAKKNFKKNYMYFMKNDIYIFTVYNA